LRGMSVQTEVRREESKSKKLFILYVPAGSFTIIPVVKFVEEEFFDSSAGYTLRDIVEILSLKIDEIWKSDAIIPVRIWRVL